MTTFTVLYDEIRNALYVNGQILPAPAGSLEARQSGDQLAVANPHQPAGADLICRWADFGEWSIDGTVYADVSSAFAALVIVCSRKRPVGDLYAIAVDIAEAGQTLIPLQQPPSLLSTVRVEVNGAVYRAPDIAASSVAVMWLNPDFPLTPSDRVAVVYS